MRRLARRIERDGRRRLFAVAVVFLPGLAFKIAKASDETEPSVRINAAHPYLALHSVSGGEPFILDQHRGKKVVMLHFAAWDGESVSALDGWKSFAEKIEGDDTTVFVGVIHELHRDRGELFVRWKKIEFPVYHDPMNFICAPRVNRAVCIDADGLVRVIAKSPVMVTDRFIEKKFEPISNAVRLPKVKPPDPRVTKRTAGEGHRPLEIIQHGDALMYSGHPVEMNEAIRTYRKAFEIAEPNAAAAFRLGSAYRLRFDSGNRQPGDWAKSCEALQIAAALAPRNDIYTAHVRQLGITTDKQASAYGWIADARQSLGGAARLNPEPLAIEMAGPASAFEAGAAPSTSPPKIESVAGVISVEHAVVYALSKEHRGEANLLFALSPTGGGFDQGKFIRMWFDSTDGLSFESRYVELVAGPTADNRPVTGSVGIRFKPDDDGSDRKINVVIVFESNGATHRSDIELTFGREPPKSLSN